jgi:hypothetical protein
LSAPAAGFTITNPAGVAGNPTFALANDLSALEAMSGTGLVVRTGSETYAQRTITNGGGVTITNGDGVSGNPTISVSPNNESALNAAAFSWFQLSTDGVTVYATLGSATSAGNGSFNVSYNNTGTWPVALLTATNASSYVLIRTSQRCSLNQAGTYQSQFKSGPTTTAIKYWLGLSASITAASKPTGATACVVYDSAISANWQLITYDGTAGSAAYTDMGVALAANTQYEVEIVFTSTSATARIRLTGGTWSTPVTYNSTNIPAANAKMYGVGLLMARTDSGAVTSNWFGTSYHSTYQ